jgi:hypothetical protein
MGTALLQVTGRKFCAGVWFEKRDEKWTVVSMAPILRKILGKVSVDKMPLALKRAKCSWQWVKVNGRRI